MTAHPAPALLDGIKVLDLTRFVAGPYGTMFLAELGADVLKIEHPRTGDATRKWAADKGGARGPDNPYFMSINRSKRSVAVDLATEEGLGLIHELVAVSDVVVHNFKQSSAEKLRLTYEDISAIKADIVYCEVSGYGNGGPERHRLGVDLIMQGELGLMQALGEPGGSPMKVPFPLIDVFTASNVAIGIAAALVRRERTGLGAHLSTSLLESGLAAMTNLTSDYLVSGKTPERLGSRHRDQAPYEVHRTKDGYIALGVANDEHWEAFCGSLGLDDLQHDPRFVVNAVRVVNRTELEKIVADIIAERTTAEWVEHFGRVGVPCSAVRTLPEVLEGEQVRHMGIVQSVDHPTHGSVRYVRNPLSVDGAPVMAKSSAPTLGADTLQGLKDFGGLPDDRLQELVSSGAISQRADS
jgi:formyl-CoA transferase